MVVSAPFRAEAAGESDTISGNAVTQDSSNPDGTPQDLPIWERLYSLFSRRMASSRYEEEPHRRGMAITMSILVSSLLWFTFTMRETHTRIIEMPTEVVNVPEDQALSQLPAGTVRVQAIGDGWSLLRLSLRPPTIPINASQSEVRVAESIPELPKNVQVQSVSPNVVNLWKERRVTRSVPVQVAVEIETPITHDLVAPPEISPDSVEVTGAASVVGEVEYWPTVERAFQDVRDTLEVRVPLSDTLRGLVAKNIDAVTLRAVSKEFTEGAREIDVTVQGQPSTQTLVSLEPSTIHVRYKVLLSQYQEAQEAMDFYATVSYDEIRNDTTGQVRPHLELPDDIVLRDVQMIPQRLGYYERID